MNAAISLLVARSQAGRRRSARKLCEHWRISCGMIPQPRMRL